ncbi:hypothetical protein BU15DRAFT_87904 [Melanogaster broomeanus]|nr:hypothetical protein BU15DRAFT_87904 [Melanogaster broomeanus]
MSILDEVISTPQDQQGSSLYAALARTTTRAITLYFSRPVRLFRPSKVSGWHSLRGHANKHGATLSRQYISSLVRNQGFLVIPKHFVPPMLANAVLGTSSTYLEPCLGHHSIFMAALSGAAAGGMQALVAAPSFRGTQPLYSPSRSDQIRDIRQVRLWMKDVREMAGRGWTGWGWGCGKDVCGFAAFFVVFEITRNAAVRAKDATEYAIQRLPSGDKKAYDRHIPRVIHALTLVCGGALAGLAYEVLCRPWDVARRVIEFERTLPSYSASHHSSVSALVRKAKEDGTLYANLSSFRQTFIGGCLPLFGPLPRVGPWGMGFLVWEAFGPGLD